MDAQIMLLADGSTIHLVHFIYRSPKGTTHAEGAPLAQTEDTWKIACVPRLVEMGATVARAVPHMRTDDTRAVTCPMCKVTEEFQRAERVLQAALSRR